VMYRYKQ